MYDCPAMSYYHEFSRANQRLIGFPAMYTPKCECRCDAQYHSGACRECELIDNLPTGFICLVNSAGSVERILPEDYFSESPEQVLEIAQNTAFGSLDNTTVSFDHFRTSKRIPTECFDRPSIIFLRGDVLRLRAEFSGIDVDF